MPAQHEPKTRRRGGGQKVQFRIGRGKKEVWPDPSLQEKKKSGPKIMKTRPGSVPRRPLLPF